MSRLHRIGNIYTRTLGLIRKSVIREINKPVWLDLYERFPPKYDPTFKRMEPDIKIKEILYTEDAVRAKVHKEFKDHLGFFSFQDNTDSVSQKLVKLYSEYISQGMSEDEAIAKIKLTL